MANTAESFVYEATANQVAKRNGDGDIAFRRISLPASAGGLINAGFEQSGVTLFTGTTTITGDAVNGRHFNANATSGAALLNLPAAASWSGLKIRLTKTDSTANTATMDGSGAEVINNSNVSGNLTHILYNQWDWIDVTSNGTSWDITGRSQIDITTAIADPGNAGAIPVTRSGYCSITSTGADTRTLAIPTFVGQRLRLIHIVDGGSVAVTAASAINIAGNTIMTATAVRAWIELVGSLTGSTKVWTVLATDGFTLS